MCELVQRTNLAWMPPHSLAMLDPGHTQEAPLLMIA